MAAENVSLESVVAEHTNHLFDATALLTAVSDRVDEEAEHETLRLVQMALDRVKAAAEALAPFA